MNEREVRVQLRATQPECGECIPARRERISLAAQVVSNEISATEADLSYRSRLLGCPGLVVETVEPLADNEVEGRLNMYRERLEADPPEAITFPDGRIISTPQETIDSFLSIEGIKLRSIGRSPVKTCQNSAFSDQG